jgi:hypothetical protein
MNSDSDIQSLLSDVVGETAPVSFREQLLERALGEVRHRKTRRVVARSVLAVACVLALLAIVARLLPVASGRESNNLMVHSRPLSPEMVVVSEPQTVEIIKPLYPDLEFVHSSTDTFRILGDNELLRLLAGRPAALVHRSPSQADLVFANPDDSNGFPTQ